MSVTYVYNRDQNDNELWAILEKTTGNIIEDLLPFEKARAITRHLNYGGGFDGWTPGFFCAKNRIPHSNFFYDDE